MKRHTLLSFGVRRPTRRNTTPELESKSNTMAKRLISLVRHVFRNSKVRYLAAWLGKPITFVDVIVMVQGYPAEGPVAVRAALVSVSEFYLTIQLEDGPLSVPLEDLKLSWDDYNARPKLIVRE